MMLHKDLPVRVWLPVVLGVILLAVVGIMYKQPIQDRLHETTYSAPSRVAAVGESARLSATGQRLFERASPLFIKASESEDLCLGEDNLGCLVTGPQIYLVDTGGDDAELAVTAAHEMLHMVYDRMNNTDRAAIDILIARELAKPSNAGLRADIARYEDDVVADDEAHSQVGTEVAIISDQLEGHYGEYFDDRRAVVELYMLSRQ